MEIYFSVLSNILGAVAISLSAYAYIISKREAIYGNLDDFYLEVLKTGMENPKFRNIEYTANYKTSFADANERISYETYAYISMNWCETVVDRASKSKVLADTWFPGVQSEYLLHKFWLEDTNNIAKYKESFRNFMKSNFDK
ncbi:MAG: hypothetical protein NTW25_14520 [Candidatus Kapabacteria bacterium]|nr:hypothetical protein [Candidatus Kapabacteria bacterium]